MSGYWGSDLGGRGVAAEDGWGSAGIYADEKSLTCATV